MRIADGSAEDHPSLLAYDSQPAVAPGTPAAAAGTGQGGVADTTGMQASQAAAGAADVRAAMAAGMAAENDRRSGYQADIAPFAAAYGDLMALPQPPSGPGIGLSDNDLPVQGIGY